MNANQALPEQLTADSAEPTRVPWLSVVLYSVIACVLAWLVMLPIWLGDGLADPLFVWLTLPMMYTPTVAALIVTFFVLKPKFKARFLGLTPFKPVVRSIVLILVWPIAFLAITIGSVALASLFGWVEFGFNTALFDEDAQIAGMSAETLAILNFALIPLIVVQATVSAFGEELGWRGFLVPALSPLGFWPTAVISSVIWGVWHSPIILLGYNFARTDIVGVLMMIGFCFFVGVFLNWSRMWCRNVWVAAVGHGALNAVATFGFLFMMTLDTERTFTQSILGLPGWIIMGTIIVIMAAVGMFGKRLPKPLVTVPAKRLRQQNARAATADGQAEPVVGTPEWAQAYDQSRSADAADVQGQPRVQ